MSPHAIGTLPAWWPSWAPFSPAFLILWMPAGFRFTCYYYRGAYYKAFWADPINCAVGEPRKTFLGERYFPLIIQNIHRYFFYLACLFIVLLSYDAWLGMWFTDADRQGTFRHRRGHDCADAERRFPGDVHLWLPLAAAS